MARCVCELYRVVQAVSRLLAVNFFQFEIHFFQFEIQFQMRNMPCPVSNEKYAQFDPLSCQPTFACSLFAGPKQQNNKQQIANIIDTAFEGNSMT